MKEKKRVITPEEIEEAERRDILMSRWYDGDSDASSSEAWNFSTVYVENPEDLPF